MTKDNILFSIIGVLLGVFAGYVFATTVNQSGYTPRRASAAQVEQDSEMPPDRSSLPSKAVVEHGADESSADTAAIEQAESEPDNFEAQMKAAAIHYRMRRFKEAISLLTRANQLRPDSYEAIVALGNSNFDAGQYETAEKWYTAALVKKPDDINVRTDLGLTFLFREKQDVDRAVKEFRRSLELNPRHEQTLQNMVVALVKKGSFNEAETTLDKLREVNPGNQSLEKLRSDLEEARATTKQPASKGK
jgi:tetratricopeptide (TPR) repeat protein